MAFCYDKLWKLLIDKGMNKTQLQEAVGVTPATIAKMGKNQNVTLSTLEKICKYLECDISEIIEYKQEK